MRSQEKWVRLAGGVWFEVIVRSKGIFFKRKLFLVSQIARRVNMKITFQGMLWFNFDMFVAFECNQGFIFSLKKVEGVLNFF